MRWVEFNGYFVTRLQHFLGPTCAIQPAHTATLDGLPIGSVLPARAEHRLEIRAVGSAPLIAVEVVLGASVLGNLLEEPSDGIDIETVVRAPEPGSHLYVRVRQEQGGAAWTSPFFFE